MGSSSNNIQTEGEYLRASDRENTLKDIILWRRPTLSLVLLLIATAVYHHCAGPNGRPFLALASDVLLAITCACGIVGFLSRFFHVQPLLDVSVLQFSQEDSLQAVSSVLSVLGAAEAVLRVAARGSDTRLFLKVIFSLYVCSVLGKALSTPTIIYAAIWMLMAIPFVLSKLEASMEESGRFSRASSHGLNQYGRPQLQHEDSLES